MSEQGINSIPQLDEEQGINPPVEPEKKLKFYRGSEFQIELRRRVDQFFQANGQPQRDCPQMYVKTAIVLVSFVSVYSLLVFVANTWWQALPLAILLGLTMAEIGFNIQHDASHQSYSKLAWVNKLLAMTLDLIGGSSYNWHWKHNVFHHTYANITGYDTDLDIDWFGRLTPYQPWYPVYRWQHLYLWSLYGLMPVRWHFYDDFRALFTGRIGQHPYPRPKGWDLVVFWGGKATFLVLAFGIPLLRHSFWTVLGFYGIVVFFLGLVLSVVFQLAHAVPEAEFPMPNPDSNTMENVWTVHQVETTVDFARQNPVMTWLLGGLNFQVEHHLFPKLCHVNYPAITQLVEETCREFGITYRQHPSVRQGILSHFRWLRQMGTPNAMVDG